MCRFGDRCWSLLLLAPMELADSRPAIRRAARNPSGLASRCTAAWRSTSATPARRVPPAGGHMPLRGLVQALDDTRD